MPLSKLIWGIILNVAVMPGAGQMAVKQKRHGSFFLFLFVLLSLSFMASLSAVIHKELAGVGITMDIMKSAQILSSQIFESHSLMFKTYGFLLGTIYITSVVDLILLYVDRD